MPCVELVYQAQISLSIIIQPTHHHFIDDTITKDNTVQNAQKISTTYNRQVNKGTYSTKKSGEKALLFCK